MKIYIVSFGNYYGTIKKCFDSLDKAKKYLNNEEYESFKYDSIYVYNGHPFDYYKPSYGYITEMDVE